MKTTSNEKGLNALQLCCTRLASEASCACKVMNAFHLNKVVQIFVPYADKEKLQQLKDNLRDELICELPLRNGSKTLLYCVLMPDLNAEQNLFVYLMELERVYGKNGELKGKFHCRVYEYADYEGEL